LIQVAAMLKDAQKTIDVLNKANDDLLSDLEQARLPPKANPSSTHKTMYYTFFIEAENIMRSNETLEEHAGRWVQQYQPYRNKHASVIKAGITNRGEAELMVYKKWMLCNFKNAPTGPIDNDLFQRVKDEVDFTKINSRKTRTTN
jgi:hypothetical protein